MRPVRESVERKGQTYGEDLDRHLVYIQTNPIKAKLCEKVEQYSYLSTQMDPIPQRLKPPAPENMIGGAEAPPLQPQDLKPLIAARANGTAEAVPLQNPTPIPEKNLCSVGAEIVPNRH